MFQLAFFHNILCAAFGWRSQRGWRFYCVKLFVKMDGKVTSYKKLKKYKILNKRSTNSLCNFLVFQTAMNELISIIIFNSEIFFE
jgi:hypothetical protein